MKAKIVGRFEQLEKLDKIVASRSPQLVAVYGRRRIGKTFLIKEYFNNNFDFYSSGIYEGSQRDEIDAFYQGFNDKTIPKPKSWMEAFIALRDYLSKSRKKNLIIFLDELPWFDVPPGKFLKAFEWFWNTWASTREGLKLIVCGSATSWMINKFISGKGGLYNRTTAHIYLEPFKLKQTEHFLRRMGISWPRPVILDAYMTFGGVPYYLSLLDSNLSLSQNIDRLFFAHNALLRNEYIFLLQSLFKEAEYYQTILNTISSKNKGLTRNEIVSLSGLPDNGSLTKALLNLRLCDFIRVYSSFGKKKKDSIFQLTDPFVLFYKRFVETTRHNDPSYWTKFIGKPPYNTWKGIAFEEVCLLHATEIKKALGIEGVSTHLGGWYFKGDEYEKGAQIDMLIDREDEVIDICEMKYLASPFAVTKNLDSQIRERENIFRGVTATKKAIRNVLITPHGIKPGKYTFLFNQIIGLDNLFI